jgi:LuxR family maltose regulon positive regulatory protein
VLLSEWAGRRAGPTAWLALTKADNDPLRFWSLFVKAAQPAQPELFPTGWQSDQAPGFLDTLFGEQEPEPAPVVIVLDDAHVLTNPQILEGLDRVVRRWSERVRLILAARSVPLLPLHQYRLAGRLCELRDADLAMNTLEASQLLSAHGVDLSEPDVRMLARRTEGWTAGLRLAAMRMEGVPRPGDFVFELAMDTGSIGEYLVQEVLSRLPVEARRLLISTSFLDEVSGAAAEAISGIDGSQRILADLAAANSFVVPVNSSGTVFRYHALLREVLQYLARHEPPDVLQDAHRRASRWFSGQGDVVGALRWAMRSGDASLARSVIAHGLPRAFVDDQTFAGERLSELAKELPSGRPGTPEDEELVITRMVALALGTDRAAALEELRSGRSEASGSAPLRAPTALDLSRLLATLMLSRTAGAYDLTDGACDRLLGAAFREEVDGIPGLRSRLLLVQSQARFSVGRTSEVQPLLNLAMVAAEQERATAVHVDILAVLAVASASAGRPRLSRQSVDRAEELLGRHPELSRPVALDLAVARGAYIQADLTTMASAMSRALAAGPPESGPAASPSAAYLQALLLSACGQLAEARTWLLGPVLNANPRNQLAVYRDCELAAIEITLGRPQRALELVQPYAQTEFAPSAAVTSARACLALGDVTRAKAYLRPVLVEPSPQVDRYIAVSAMLCEAQIALAEHAEAGAVAHIDRAIQLADGDIVMPFVTLTSAFGPLLQRHPTTAGRWPDPQNLPPGVIETSQLRRGTLAEPLTERELAVLRLITTTMSTAEIANELYLSANTVKTHLAAIYRKIGVSKRRDAVAQARELELL